MKQLVFFISLSLLLVIVFNPKRTLALEINPQSETVINTLQSINKAVQGERIKDFTSEISVNKDGTISVKETIKYFFEDQRHGIFRNIPFTKRDDAGNRVDLKFEDFSVTDGSGQSYKFEKSEDNEQWILKIGDANKTITGDHTYIISYNVSGALGYFENHDELYWNITGTGWDVPIQKTSTTIALPDNLNEDLIRATCYTGPYNSTKQNCTGTTDGKTTTFSATLFLNPHEGLTTVVGFPKGTVEVLLPEVYVPFFERWYGKITLALIILVATAWYVILPVYLVYRWFSKGRDPYVGMAATSMFDLPKVNKRTLSPGETGALLDETVNKRDLFSAIVDLARRGYLKIAEPKEKEFHLVKTSPKKIDTLLPFEKTLMDGIFSTGDNIELKKVKFYTVATKAEDQIYKSLVDLGLFPKNPKSTRNTYYAIGAIAMFTLNFVLAFVAFVFGRVMPRKTFLGASAARQAQSVKNFLKSQERQLNFQGDKQMLFEKLLPVAVAFGVEKAWAKRFEGFDLKNPDWYEGSSMTHFNAAIFASHISNSYSNFAISSTPPSSSSSSGFSGGSSGGGGGGGGGGSW